MVNYKKIDHEGKNEIQLQALLSIFSLSFSCDHFKVPILLNSSAQSKYALCSSVAIKVCTNKQK